MRTGSRVYDFVHWLMLIGVNIGAWLIGGVTIWWFILKLVLLSIIGWQIGVGVQRKLKLTTNERKTGITAAIIALLFGLTSGYIRTIDQSYLGWGWLTETLTAVVATVIVIKWIWHDIQTISFTYTGYPRSFFLKGIFGNFLILLFWIHIISMGDVNSSSWWLQNTGLTFNVLVGNLIYTVYWLVYEFHKKKQAYQTSSNEKT